MISHGKRDCYIVFTTILQDSGFLNKQDFNVNKLY